MDGQYTEAHDIDSEINTQNEKKNTNKITSHMKKNHQYIKLLQLIEWNAATESAHTEAGNKEFQAGTVLTKKRILVRVNDRWATLKLEWVLCTSSGQVGTVHLSRMPLFKDGSDICILPGRGYSFVIKWLLEERGEDRGQLGCRLLKNASRNLIRPTSFVRSIIR